MIDTDTFRDITSADKKRQQDKRALNERDDNDLRFVMADARGRRFVWRLLAEAGVYRSTFAPDAMVMAHAEGKRDTGLRLLDRVQRVTPNDYITAQQENTRGLA